MNLFTPSYLLKGFLKPSPAKQIKRTTSSLLRAHSRNSLNRLLFESEHSLGGGGDDRPLSFRLFQLVVMIIRLVTPISYLYLMYLMLYVSNTRVHAILFGDNGTSHTVGTYIRMLFYTIFTFWMIIEAVFFPYYCYMFTKLLKLNHGLSHFGSTRETRQRLVKNCFEALKLGAVNSDEDYLYIRKAMEGYFLDVPVQQIYRENFRSWVSWAFFGRDLSDLSHEESDELDEYVRYIESLAQWTFQEGYSKDLMALRLTLDPLFATQRPFVFYAVIMTVNIITHVILYLMGFRRRRAYNTNAQSIYYRPANSSKRNDSLTQDSIDKPLPIVFIHGIGIGFAHYLGMLLNLPSDVDVYLVEWPHVAMQLRSHVPSSEQVVHTICQILDDDQHEHACFVAHSLGTTAVSWMLHSERGIQKVAATILLDPVTFLLCDPTVATTFVYKDPTTTLDFLMHFFLSRELFIANSLSRHFSWSENIMFIEDLEECSKRRLEKKKPIPSQQRQDDSNSNSSNSVIAQVSENDSSTDINHTIIISTDDTIIPVGPVTRYLQSKAKHSSGGLTSKQGKCFEILFFEGLLHGEMFLYPSHVRHVIEKIRTRCGLSVGVTIKKKQSVDSRKEGKYQ